jgi:hypothetical protein
MYQAGIGEVGGINEYKNKWDLFISHFVILVHMILVLGQWQQPFSSSFLWIILSPWGGEGPHHHRCHPGDIYSCLCLSGFWQTAWTVQQWDQSHGDHGRPPRESCGRDECEHGHI